MKKLLVIGLLISACNVFARNAYGMTEVETTDVNALDVDPTYNIGATLNESQTAMKKSQRAAAHTIHHTHRRMANEAVVNVKKQGYRNLRDANVQAMRNIDRNKKRLEAQLNKLSAQHEDLSRKNSEIDRKISKLQ